MKLLRINEDYRAEPERDSLMLIPEFATLFTLAYNKREGDHDGRARKRVRKELTYIFFMYDYRSEYAEYSEEERKLEALGASELPEDYEISGELEAAIAKFQDLQDTRELKLLKSAYGVIDKMRKYFDDVEIRDTNVKSVIGSLKELGHTLDGLKKLEDRVRKQQTGQVKIRGDQETGRL